VWIGLLSYTLYLCHMAVFEAVRTTFHLNPMVAGIAGLPLAILFAQFMRTFVEVPILTWRRKHRRVVNQMDAEPLSLSEASINLGRGPVEET
jgi:peptidoglycan/LPS O-acetylase OafA/YrhL